MPTDASPCLAPPSNIPEWVSWLNTLSPIRYGFFGLLLNEADGRTFACTRYTRVVESYTFPEYRY